MQFFILDVESARRGDLLNWWRPNKCGYTHRLDVAGRYDDTEIASDFNLNNGTHTMAVPCELAERLSCQVVPGGSTMLNKLKQAACELLPDTTPRPGL